MVVLFENRRMFAIERGVIQRVVGLINTSLNVTYCAKSDTFSFTYSCLQLLSY